jgi:hypothetical protein
METERVGKVPLEITVRREHAETTGGARHGPRLSLAARFNIKQRSDPTGVLTTTQAQVGIDELARRRQINILYAELVKPEHAVLELLRGRRCSTEAEVQFAKSSDRPDLIEMDSKLGAQGERLSGVRTAVVFVALTRFEPGHAGKRGGDLRLLTGLAREPRRLVVFDVRSAPVLCGRVITPDTVQQPRQDAQRNPSPGCFDHLVDKIAKWTGLAKPE